jgi:hypothetical protein
LLHPSVATVPPQRLVPKVDIEDAPDDLVVDERNVWLELAPHAIANGTLTDATSLAFRLLCRNVVLERRYAVSVLDAGGANHRGMIQRIDAELLRFNLAPCGKAIASLEGQPAVDPMKEKYFGSKVGA